jgi:hypothetical protein
VSREKAEEKAKGYLGEGRVRIPVVTPEVVEADVQGSELAYKTRREGRRWSCARLDGAADDG